MQNHEYYSYLVAFVYTCSLLKLWRGRDIRIIRNTSSTAFPTMSTRPTAISAIIPRDGPPIILDKGSPGSGTTPCSMIWERCSSGRASISLRRTNGRMEMESFISAGLRRQERVKQCGETEKQREREGEEGSLGQTERGWTFTLPSAKKPLKSVSLSRPADNNAQPLPPPRHSFPFVTAKILRAASIRHLFTFSSAKGLIPTA